jgi:hypothetical protein
MNAEGCDVSLHTTGKKGIQGGRTGNLGEKETHRQLTKEPHGSSQGPGRKAGWTLAKLVQHGQGPTPNGFKVKNHTPRHGALVGVALPPINPIPLESRMGK